MPILTISGVHVDFPDAQALPQAEADFILNWLRLRRITNRMVHWMRQQPQVPTPAAFQAKLLEIDAAFSWSDIEDLDAVEHEAREIASATILQRLAQAGLPPPRDLDPHIAQLIATNPNITRIAQERVIARINAAREILAQ